MIYICIDYILFAVWVTVYLIGVVISQIFNSKASKASCHVYHEKIHLKIYENMAY